MCEFLHTHIPPTHPIYRFSLCSWQYNIEYTCLIVILGCPRETSLGRVHDNIHADHLDEHRGPLHHVLQAFLLWSSGLGFNNETWTKKTTNYDFIFIFLQVSVNLTVMLVLTTMFVRWIVTIFILTPSSSSSYPPQIIASCFASVSNDLPRTSYLKMVDIWLIFNLFIPFLEVLLHTYKVSWTFVS